MRSRLCGVTEAQPARTAAEIAMSRIGPPLKQGAIMRFSHIRAIVARATRCHTAPSQEREETMNAKLLRNAVGLALAAMLGTANPDPTAWYVGGELVQLETQLHDHTRSP